LHVKACSTLRRYKKRRVDPQEVGRELGVEAVLIGRVLQSGEDILIRVELVEVENGRQLWGEQFREKGNDIVEAQETIVKKIADQILLRLTKT
jgi:eukaryotic-like serine/threonine-protein kinase